MRGLSYVQKTAIPYLVILVAALVTIGITTSTYFERFVLSSWEKELTAETQLIAAQLAEKLLIPITNVELFAEVEEYAKITGDRVTVLQANGHVIAESEHDIATMENHFTRPEVQAAVSGKILPIIRLSTTMHQRYIYVAAPIYDGTALVGVIRLAKSLEVYDTTVNRFRLVLSIVAGGSFAIALLLIIFQSSKPINPLRKISEEIFRFSEGELKTLPGEDRKDEIGLIIQAHNSLIEKVKLQIQSLQNEQTKLSAILFNMTDGVILVNALGQVTLINTAARKLFDFSQTASGADSLIDVVRQHQIVELWQQTLRSGKSQNATIQTSLDKENIQVISSLLGPVLPGEVLLLFQDQSLLRKLETVRKDFVSNISHELRTPLASLKALTETLQNGAMEDPSTENRFLSQMNEEIDNLTQIVQELLELAKIESGRVPLELQTTASAELIDSPVERMMLQAERAGIKIEKTLSPDLPEIEVDVTRIHQVMINLIHNAIKFTAPGGKITVSAEKRTDSVVFSVADTGVGISPVDLPRIFERFYKVDRSRSAGGTGLGLSIARHLVELHHGSIWVESIQGEGSTFFFSIPIPKSSGQT
jgi:two-component system, OmpR family, phosphate regulon sensor histidine kinase PhoR